MAAMAVFRDLYNQKKDIYSAIAEFVKLAIVENGWITFDLQEISNIIKENNGIELPLAVIKRSLNRLNFLHKERATYTMNCTPKVLRLTFGVQFKLAQPHSLFKKSAKSA